MSKNDYKELSYLFDDYIYSGEDDDACDAYNLTAERMILNGSWGASVYYFDLEWPNNEAEAQAAADYGKERMLRLLANIRERQED